MLSKESKQKKKYDSLIKGASKNRLICAQCDNLTEIIEELPPLIVNAENYDKEKMFNLFREPRHDYLCSKCEEETYHFSTCTLDIPPDLLSIKFDSSDDGYEIFSTQILQEATFKVFDGN